WFVAAAWMVLAFVASLVSIRTGISVALIEIGMGVIGGNFLGLQTSEWVNFLASFGAVLLTFLAGAEIDPDSLRVHLKAALAIGVALRSMPRLSRALIATFGATRVSEPEVKFLFLVLFALGGLATTARSEAVLPAYLVGLVVAGVFVEDRVLVTRMRSIAFSMLTPFYFIKAGLFVSLPAMVTSAGLILALLAVKLAAKSIGVWPLARVFKLAAREANYTKLMMATGLTFGTISGLFGLEHD